MSPPQPWKQGSALQDELGVTSESRRDLTTSQPALSTEGLRLRIETLTAQKAEAFQRLADLHRTASGDQADSGIPVTPAEMAEELDATQRELNLLSQQQCELEVALAKACAREQMEPRLQPACGACLRYRQKLTAHRAELDRQLEAFRAEMHATSANLEHGRIEARSAEDTEMARRHAEQKRAAEAEAQERELAEIKRQDQEFQELLRDLESQVAGMASRMQQLVAGHEEMVVRYQNVGEGCVAVLTELEGVKQDVGSLQPQAEGADEEAAKVNTEVQRLQVHLNDVRNAVVHASGTAREFRPRVEDQLATSEREIQGIFVALRNLEHKHNQLTELLGRHKQKLGTFSSDIVKVKNWLSFAANPPAITPDEDDD